MRVIILLYTYPQDGGAAESESFERERELRERARREMLASHALKEAVPLTWRSIHTRTKDVSSVGPPKKKSPHTASYIDAPPQLIVP
jgi:hypothetical protein